ncbi:MAG TPA: response regulator transcription factor [Anaerolineales bacterium]|nr:response regulator transcription factor [Anaerolineae bacterium]HIQ01985.1 response regulator transcription factor [Anaerolineales bacterium]
MGRIRIILAEDHVLVREGTRELLQREDDLEIVAEAGDGVEAVRLTAEHHPEVVVMDVAMPKLNGIEATRQIKAISPSTAVLALTAYDHDQYVFALLEAGAAGYLLKDVSTTDLVEAIRAVYAGESVLHPAIARKVINYFARRTDKAGEAPLDQLTEREMEVLKLAARGITNREIASELVISIRTVQVHLSNIFGKLGVGSRTEAVVYALRKGLLTLEDIS